MCAAEHCWAGLFVLQEPNLKYLALENLARLVLVPEVLEAIKGHQQTIIANLKVGWVMTYVTKQRDALPLGFSLPAAAAAAAKGVVTPCN